MKVTLSERIRGTPETRTVEVELPALPRAGDYCSHDPSGVSGYVDHIIFYWPEDGSPMEIEVRLRG